MDEQCIGVVHSGDECMRKGCMEVGVQEMLTAHINIVSAL